MSDSTDQTLLLQSGGNKGVPQRLATADCETDPFQHGREVRPFVWGYYDPELGYHHFWHDEDCTVQFVTFLGTIDTPTTIYFHNGGRFDFLFLLRHLAQEVVIINGRIVECRIGRHVLRDSWAILPVRQAGFSQTSKTNIDYMKMRRAVRHLHRTEILSYLSDDVTELFKAVDAFWQRFGIRLTMAGAAVAELRGALERAHNVDSEELLQRLRLGDDADLRRWYFGGRVECFEDGIVHGDLKVYDVNSMYPSVMASMQHPVSASFVPQNSIDDRTDFVMIDADSDGALPWRDAKGSLRFPHGRGEYRTTGHELREAMDLGLVRVHRLTACWRATKRMSFAEFIHPIYDARMRAKAEGDETAVLHLKLVMNSCYGRFALNPEKLRTWCVLPAVISARMFNDVRSLGYEPQYLGPEVCFWSRPVDEEDKQRAIMNVATGASITGAARAVLLREIAQADRPIYCDTDSLICEGLRAGADIDDTRLGAWGCEKTGTRIAIGGRKMYALFDGDDVVKIASKGVKLKADEIVRVASGDTVTYRSEAPTMSLTGAQSYLSREVRMTV